MEDPRSLPDEVQDRLSWLSRSATQALGAHAALDMAFTPDLNVVWGERPDGTWYCSKITAATPKGAKFLRTNGGARALVGASESVFDAIPKAGIVLNETWPEDEQDDPVTYSLSEDERARLLPFYRDLVYRPRYGVNQEGRPVYCWGQDPKYRGLPWQDETDHDIFVVVEHNTVVEVQPVTKFGAYLLDERPQGFRRADGTYQDVIGASFTGCFQRFLEFSDGARLRVLDVS